MPEIALVSRKGGVGKTTLAVNIAACLANQGGRVLLCDLDPQAAATSHLGVDYTNLRTVGDLFEGAAEAKDVVVRSRFGVDLIPASPRLAVTEISLLQTPGGECLLREALQDIRSEYDWILVDTPPSLGKLTLNALVAAKWVLIPALAEWASVEPVAHTLEAVEAVQRRLNGELRVAGIAMNRVNTRTRSAQLVRERLADLGVPVMTGTLRATVRISDALGCQEPILTHDPRHAVCADVLTLTQEVVSIAG